MHSAAFRSASRGAPVAPAPPPFAALAFLWRQVRFAAGAGIDRIDEQRGVEQTGQLVSRVVQMRPTVGFDRKLWRNCVGRM